VANIPRIYLQGLEIGQKHVEAEILRNSLTFQRVPDSIAMEGREVSDGLAVADISRGAAGG
jgi:hypothetical protein